jgi:hypothetical protein
VLQWADGNNGGSRFLCMFSVQILFVAAAALKKTSPQQRQQQQELRG